MTKILLVQGPNMQYLGKRRPELYGTTSAAELDAMCNEHARTLGYELEILYSNAEGPVVDRIYDALEEGLDGIVMNPAAFMKAGYALNGCLRAIPVPYIEVHVTSPEARGFHSQLAAAAVGVVAGFGLDGYRMALDRMFRLVSTADEIQRAGLEPTWK